MNPYGDLRVINAAEYGMVTLPQAMGVVVQWQGGAYEAFNDVTRAYVTNDGRVTLMAGNTAVCRLSLGQAHKRHRKARVVSTFVDAVAQHTILSEMRHLFR
jgi:hypothetical protein